ncbi:MAG TPA: hypothetical protein VFG84_09735 [Gemmatimonadaceae bacterium]|nr:hypothetical protein [Gemmatimonadaceae bacterium]
MVDDDARDGFVNDDDPVLHYHELLADDQLAVDSHAMLVAQLRERDLVFGGRPLCTVLRPRFTTPERHRALATGVRDLMRVFARAHAAAVERPDVRSQFRLHDWEETLLLESPPGVQPSPLSRLDAFLGDEPGSFRLTEYNAETPAGGAYNDAIADSFVDIPVMRAFGRRFEAQALPARHGVLHALLDSWEAFRGMRIAPRIGILDWRGVPTEPEFRLFQAYFRSRGLSCVIGDPRQAEYHGGSLTLDGRPVDLIYKRVLITELVERCGMESAVIRAVRDGAVCLANGFGCKLLHKKASLAVLSDERNAHLFDGGGLAAIAAHVPWTRVVEERRTTADGREVDLVAHILAERERLVLKPNDDYGGAGIVLGWTVDAAGWEQAVARALAEPYIVQARIAIPGEVYPAWVDDRVTFAERQLDTAPFISRGAYMDGMLTRLSTEALLNVTAGGGSQVPTFLVNPR